MRSCSRRERQHASLRPPVTRSRATCRPRLCATASARDPWSRRSCTRRSRDPRDLDSRVPARPRCSPGIDARLCGVTEIAAGEIGAARRHSIARPPRERLVVVRAGDAGGRVRRPDPRGPADHLAVRLSRNTSRATAAVRTQRLRGGRAEGDAALTWPTGRRRVNARRRAGLEDVRVDGQETSSASTTTSPRALPRRSPSTEPQRGVIGRGRPPAHRPGRRLRAAALTAADTRLADATALLAAVRRSRTTRSSSRLAADRCDRRRGLRLPRRVACGARPGGLRCDRTGRSARGCPRRGADLLSADAYFLERPARAPVHRRDLVTRTSS